MERGERTGLAIAVAGHVVLFGLLSVGFLSTPNPEKLKVTPIDISLVKDVALEAASPTPNQQAAQSIAPEEGAPEDAAPPEPVEAEPEPQPAPPPPAPQPKPQPRPQPKPEPAPKPEPRPVPKPKPAEKPQPRPEPKPKPAPAKPAPAKPVHEAKPAAPARPSRSEAKPTTSARGQGKSDTATATKPRGSRLGSDFLKGLSPDPSPSRSEAAPAAKMGAKQLADIGSAIQRQVQPCANRQVTPGPGAERIRVAINLRINRDGSLAAEPRVVGHTGVDGENERYVDRVDALGIATFKGCSPLRGLPQELYDVPNGWRSITLRYKLPG